MSYQDRQLKKAQEEIRRQKFFAASGAESATFISQTGKAIRMGKQAPLVEKQFSQMTLEEIEALPADKYREYLAQVDKAEVAEAVAYLKATNQTVKPASIDEAKFFTIPYLRLLKAIQLTINAPSMMGPEVKEDADFWTFEEYKAMSPDVRDNLNNLVSQSLENHGQPEYAGMTA
jgi:hypothetical protein